MMIALLLTPSAVVVGPNHVVWVVYVVRTIPHAAIRLVVPGDWPWGVRLCNYYGSFVWVPYVPQRNIQGFQWFNSIRAYNVLDALPNPMDLHRKVRVTTPPVIRTVCIA